MNEVNKARTALTALSELSDDEIDKAFLDDYREPKTVLDKQICLSRLSFSSLFDESSDFDRNRALFEDLRLYIHDRTRFRIKDTALSSRMVNYCSNRGLMPIGQKDGHSWKRLSFLDMVYIEVVARLKDFGFKSNKMPSLTSIFYDKNIDFVFYGIFSGVEIKLWMLPDGRCYMVDPSTQTWLKTLLNRISKPIGDDHIQISINQAVNRILTRLGVSDIETLVTSEKIVQTALRDPAELFDEKMQQVIKIITQNKYKQIELVKRDGEINSIEAIRNSCHIDPKMSNLKLIQQILSEKDEYSEIRIKDKKGTLQSYDIVDKFKF